MFLKERAVWVIERAENAYERPTPKRTRKRQALVKNTHTKRGVMAATTAGRLLASGVARGSLRCFVCNTESQLPNALPLLVGAQQGWWFSLPQNVAMRPKTMSSGALAKTEGTNVPTTNAQGAAFPNDLRSTSGLGRGDGNQTHTSKWLSEGEGPMEMIARVPPMAVETKIVACRGGQSQLGHPVEFIKVYGTTENEPAVCKYCGLRYYYCGGH